MEFKPFLFLKPEPKHQPRSIHLLEFGRLPVPISEVKVREPSIHKVLNELRAIQSEQDIDEAQCQTDLPLPKQAEGTFIDVVGMDSGKILRRVQVKNDEEVFIVTRPKPASSQAKTEVKVKTPEPSVPQKEVVDEAQVYLSKVMEDPLWEYKQTMEFKLKELTEKLQYMEHTSSKLNLELRSKNMELQAQYDELMRERKALLGMQKQNEPPKTDEEQAIIMEDKNLLQFYAYNQALLAEIEASKKAREAERLRPQVKTVRVTKLTPAVKRRPENWRTQNVKARVTTRMSQAFQQAERAIRESNRVKRLMGK
mmetsp:Transcript_9261/g.17695  ORF Transcript_9261/g.17695 Transcript_9261/m.17695 type:complete len:311 (-) Transcript_9261:3572-4504(-)